MMLHKIGYCMMVGLGMRKEVLMVLGSMSMTSSESMMEWYSELAIIFSKPSSLNLRTISLMTAPLTKIIMEGYSYFRHRRITIDY